MKKPLALEDPFLPDWGVKKDDSALSNKNIAWELVLKGMLPVDRVESRKIPPEGLSSLSHHTIAMGTLYLGEAVERMNYCGYMAEKLDERNASLESKLTTSKLSNARRMY
ncbi:hypothetical protein Scep_014347 [Stephania cephalantha]|uniref:Uncharacterized protein n=1 Tax=Stephania cephalantha TaxID=152367 RepID=A0AAP0P2X5_9MAGN